MSDKTLVLGQILMAVENLLARCTDKHGLVLKHTETNAHQEGAPKPSAGATMTEAQKGTVKAMQDLEVIADYMSDFKLIADVASSHGY
jgi:hypothetical protein